MKHFLSAILCLTFAMQVVAEESTPPTPPPALPETIAKKMTLSEEGSYLIGTEMAMRSQKAIAELKLDKAILMQGFLDVMNKQPLKSNPNERYQIVIKALVEEAQKKMSAVGDENMRKGKAYLEGLKGKDGITFTESGMAWEVVKASKGASPTATDKVLVHYRGTLISGEEFDSSYKRGQPFPVSMAGGVIPGWIEALKIMQVGSKYRFHIPSELAYGPRGAGAMIGPNSVLVFEIEMLEIVNPAK